MLVGNFSHNINIINTNNDNNLCGLRLNDDDESLRVQWFALRLGSELCLPFSFVHGSVVDTGAHAHAQCKRNRGRFQRHQLFNELNNYLTKGIKLPPGHNFAAIS